MRTLHLAVKKIYFDAIQSGAKVQEFRLCTPYWEKRLAGREYDDIVITCGYPAKDDAERRLMRAWRGYERIAITHPHFGPDEVKVFAIHLGE